MCGYFGMTVLVVGCRVVTKKNERAMDLQGQTKYHTLEAKILKFVKRKRFLQYLLNYKNIFLSLMIISLMITTLQNTLQMSFHKKFPDSSEGVLILFEYWNYFAVLPFGLNFFVFNVIINILGTVTSYFGLPNLNILLI